MESNPKQVVFNKVYVHLLTQMSVASTVVNHIKGNPGEWAVCAYRGVNGKKCAFGACISDEDYLPEMEAQVATDPIFKKILENLGVTPKFMVALQNIHDEGYPEEWHERLADFAKKHELTIPEMPS